MGCGEGRMGGSEVHVWVGVWCRWGLGLWLQGAVQGEGAGGAPHLVAKCYSQWILATTPALAPCVTLYSAHLHATAPSSTLLSPRALHATQLQLAGTPHA